MLQCSYFQFPVKFDIPNIVKPDDGGNSVSIALSVAVTDADNHLKTIAVDVYGTIKVLFLIIYFLRIISMSKF